MLRLDIPITKVDAARRLVTGLATAEVADRAGEICDYATTKPMYEKWSEAIATSSGGKSLGNLRAMHGKIAAGKVTALGFNDSAKQIEITAKVVDDAEWQKVEEGVYTGFSQGGSYAKRWTDAAGATRYTADPHEISLVDLPCLAEARFEMVKADGSHEWRRFKEVEKAGARNSAEDQARIQEMHDTSTAPGDLTTLAAVKQWLGVTSDADDALIDGLVTAVSRAICADLGRPSVLPATYTETVDGGDRSALWLRNWPATQVQTVTVDGVVLAPSLANGRSGYVLDAADAAPPGAMQHLAYRGGVFARGRQNVAVSYRAGYEILGELATVPATAPYVVIAVAPFGAWRVDTGVSGATGAYTAAGGVYTFTAAAAGQAITLSYGYVPNDLSQAAGEWVADRYAARTRIGQSAKTLGGQETTSFIVKAMPDAVDRLLQPYRRVAR